MAIDVAKANEAGFDVVKDGKDHASITPKNDADGTKLKEWAESKEPAKTDPSKTHDLTHKLYNCKC